MTLERSPRTKRDLVGEVMPPISLFVITLIGWILTVRLEWISDLILPDPLSIAIAFYELAITGLVWPHLWATMLATVGGFVIGSGIAISLAVASGFSQVIRKMVYPYMVALQAMPRIAVAPIVITWLGFGLSPKVALAALICFFIVYINMLTGLMSVDAESLELFRSLRASRRQVFFELMLPTAMPVLFAGLKTAMTLALIGAIVAEFVSANRGLGLLIQRFSFQLNMSEAFAVLIGLMFLGLGLFGLMEYIDRRFVFWNRDQGLQRKTLLKQRKARAEETRPKEVAHEQVA